MYYILGLLGLLLGFVAIAAGRRIHAPQTPQEELRGLARAGLIVGGAFLLLAALALLFTAVTTPTGS